MRNNVMWKHALKVHAGGDNARVTAVYKGKALILQTGITAS